jgi:hypothetical protein
VPELLKRIIETQEKTPEERQAALSLLYHLSTFPKSHAQLISDGNLQVLVNRLAQFAQKSHADVTKDDLAELILTFEVLANFCGNAKAQPELQSLKVVEKMDAVFRKYNEVYFLSDVYIRSLGRIADSYQGAAFLRQAKFDLKEVCRFALNTNNSMIIDATRGLVGRVLDDESVAALEVKVKAGGAEAKEGLEVLSFLGDNPAALQGLNDPVLVDQILKIISLDGANLVSKLAAINALLILSRASVAQATHLQKVGGLDTVFDVVNSDNSLILWSQLAALVQTVVNQLVAEDPEGKLGHKYLALLLGRLENLGPTLDSFLRQAVTQERALNSISWHQGEVARQILKTLKNLKQTDVIAADSALTFLVAQTFALNVLTLASELKTKSPSAPFHPTDTVLSVLLLFMKVFRSAEALHDQVFAALCACTFTLEQATSLATGPWFPFLCDLVLKHPEWKRTALHIMRFIAAVIKTKANLKPIQSNINAIKLVALVKNYVIEEDYQHFESIDNTKDQTLAAEVEAGEVSQAAPPRPESSISFAEEREVYHTGAKIIEELIDASALATFRANVERGVQNFKPKPEIIQLLRADLAVLACVNAVNVFGSEGLKSGLHQKLKDYLAALDKAANGSNYVDKEKLVGDVIRAAANFICVTGTEAGVKQYEAADCSTMVFGLLERSIKDASSPLQAYVLLKVFKEWLVNRLEIIEMAEHTRRTVAGSSDSFMLVSNAKVEAVMTDVLDALYQTHSRFYKNERVVNLNMEVISLLCWLSGAWKKRVAVALIPQLLEVLNSDLYGLKTDTQAIELLKQLTGTDDRSEEGNTRAIEAALVGGGLTKVFKVIAYSGFDPEFVASCQPLIEGLIIQDTEADAAATKKLIDDFLGQIDTFIGLPEAEKNDSKRLGEVALALEHMNSFALADALGEYLKEQKFPQKLGQIWQFVNANIGKSQDRKVAELLENLDKACAVGAVNLVSRPQVEGSATLFDLLRIEDFKPDTPDVLVNCLKSLYRNANNPEMVWFCATVINSRFPGPQADWVANAHAKLNGKDSLEEIRQMYQQDASKEFVKEVNDMYLNLTEDRTESLLSKEINKHVKELDAAILDRDIHGANEMLRVLAPWLSQPEALAVLPSDAIENRVLALLTLLQTSVKSKLGKTGRQLADDGLASMSVPDLLVNERQKLREEVALSQNLIPFLSGLSRDTQEALQKNDEIMKALELPLVLNGETSSLKLMEQLLEFRPSVQKLNAAGMFQTVTYILFRKNKDAFKHQAQIEAEDFGKSTIMALKNSNISTLNASVLVGRPKPAGLGQAMGLEAAGGNIFASSLPADNANSVRRLTQNRAEQIAENLALYTKVVTPLVTPEKIVEITNEYIDSLRKLAGDNPSTISRAIIASRQMISILHLKDQDFDFTPHSKDLNDAFNTFYKLFKTAGCPSKKLLRLTEGVLAKFCKRFDGTKHSQRDANLWNNLVGFYLVGFPELVAGNTRKVFKVLGLTKPGLATRDYAQLVFDPAVGKFGFKFDFDRINILSASHQKSANIICKNLVGLLAKGRVSPPQLFNVLEGVTRSRTGVTELLQSELWDTVIRLLDTFEDYQDKPTFANMAHVVVNACGATKGNDALRLKFNQRVHTDNYCKKFFDVIDGFQQHLFRRSVQALTHIYTSVDNPSGFYDQKIPEKLLEIVGPAEDWKPESEGFFLLLGFMIENDSFESMLLGLSYPSMIKEYLEAKLLKSPPGVAKLESAGEGLILASSNLEVRMVELMAYQLGEFSKYSHYAHSGSSQDSLDPQLVFRLFKAFQACGTDVILAIKLIEAVRNGIYSFSDDETRAAEHDLKGLTQHIAQELQKHVATPLVIRYLQDILLRLKEIENASKVEVPSSTEILAAAQLETKSDNDLIVRRLSKAERNAFASTDAVSAQKNIVNFTLSDIAELLRKMNKTLETQPLSEIEANLLGVCLERLSQHFAKGVSNTLFTLYSLEIPFHLRLLANSANAGAFYRKEALLLLLGFAGVADLLQKMVSTEFFVQKSIENCKEVSKKGADIDALDGDSRQILEKDLNFLHMLTRSTAGAEVAIELEKSHIGLLAFLITVADSQTKAIPIKAGAFMVINNILTVQRFEPIEDHVIRRLHHLFQDNHAEAKTTVPMLYLVSIVAKADKANRTALVNAKLFEELKGVIDVFQKDDLVNVALACAVLETVRDTPEVHAKALSSAVMPFLASAFNNALGEKRLYDHVANMILQIGYQSNEKKLRLIDIGYAAGLITLFDLFSAGQLYDQDICLSIVKCMANFSVMPIGAEHLLKDKVIVSFRRYFEAYKETHEEQVKLVMLTLSNMAYMPKQLNLDMIVKDGGVQLMIDCLSFAEASGKDELVEACIDALTQISADTKALQFLQLTNVIDIIVDVVRRQTNDQLIYKGLMCMNQLTRYTFFSNRIFEKGGHGVAAEIIKSHPKDPKNVLQGLKLLKSLVAVHPDKPRQFIQAGVPEKIVKVFSEEWP